MYISWHGSFCIKIQAGDKTLVIDPLSPQTGVGPLKGAADVVALTNKNNPDMSYINGLTGDFTVLDTAGEYEVAGFGLHAMPWRDEAGTERTIQRWNIESMVLLHVGALNRELTTQELSDLEKTDIHVLFLPIGGGSGLSLKQALALVTTIEPRILIPIHYHIPKFTGEKLDGLDVFAKEMGSDISQTEKRFNLKANKLPEEDMATVILSPV